jgi:hypothetical protein
MCGDVCDVVCAAVSPDADAARLQAVSSYAMSAGAARNLTHMCRVGFVTRASWRVRACAGC